MSNIFISLFTFNFFLLIITFVFFQFCRNVRVKAAKSLGEIGNGKQKIIDSLIYSLKNDHDS